MAPSTLLVSLLIVFLVLLPMASSAPRFPFIRAKTYPHPISAAPLSSQEYIDVLSQLLEDSNVRVATLSQKMSTFRQRFQSTKASASKIALDKIMALQKIIDNLESSAANTDELKAILAKQKSLVAEIRQEMLEVFEEEMEKLKQELTTITTNKVKQERDRMQQQLDKLRKEKDTIIQCEREKVLKVLAALEEGEVKRREAEIVKAGGGGKEIVGKSVTGKRRYAAGARATNMF